MQLALKAYAALSAEHLAEMPSRWPGPKAAWRASIPGVQTSCRSAFGLTDISDEKKMRDDIALCSLVIS